MIIKVCGMANPEIMLNLSLLNIDMLGFIFYHKSPRFVEGKINPHDLLKINKNIIKTGVFVDNNETEILNTTEIWHLDSVQLHSNESPDLCGNLKNKGLIVIKAFNLNTENDYKDFIPVCDYFLFDTPSASYGGSGTKFNWNLINKYNESTPFLLSGGISENDVDEILAIKHPSFAGIDINSKFELSPGVKDIKMISEFVSKLRSKEN